MSVLLKILIGLSAAALIAIAAYAIMNPSGHTGWEPLASLLLFGPTLAVGAFLRKKHRRPAILAICIGAAGISLIVALDQTNRLVQYERWAKRGMP